MPDRPSRRPARASFGLALLAMVLMVCGCTVRGGRAPGPMNAEGAGGLVWDVAARQAIAPEALAARLAEADVAILGEIHDNPVHHERQAWLVAAIKPVGLAFEMIPEASEEGIAVFRAQGAEPGRIGPAIGWDRLGWPDWTLYRPIVEAAPDAYVAGGGVSRADVALAMRQGAARAFGPGAEAAGLFEPLPAEMLAEARAEMVASHCNTLSAAQAGPMVDAQRLRDARFAAAVLRGREKGGGGRAALITGNGQARRDRGVPVYLARLAPGLEVRTLGQIEVEAGADPAALAVDAPFDFVWFSSPVDGRSDPCKAFRRS